MLLLMFLGLLRTEPNVYLALLFLWIFFLAWLPGLVWFIKDQMRLYQYNKNHQENANFMVRIVVFLVGYLFFAFCG
jgi:hypothetical protein